MMKKIKESLSAKLCLYIISAFVIIFVSITAYNYFESKKYILQINNENILTLENAAINRINTFLTVPQYVAMHFAESIDISNYSKEVLIELEKNVLKKHSEVYGVGIAYAPNTMNVKAELFCPYYFRTKNGTKYTDLAGETEGGYKYYETNWYINPEKMGKGIWGEPYFDEDSGAFLVTYSVPFYLTRDGKEEFGGVAACDITLDWFQKIISDINPFKSGYTFVLSSKGTYLAHPNKEYYIKEKNFYTLSEEFHDPLRGEIGQRMTSGETGSQSFYSFQLNEECIVYYSPLKTTGWSIGVVVPERELFSGLNTLLWKSIALGLAGFVLTFAMVIYLSGKATTPLRKLTMAAKKIGLGDFTADIPKVNTRDEVGMLSKSFTAMKINLIKYIKNVKEMSAANERIEHELKLAGEIQQSIIPKIFPDSKAFNIHAALYPAKEVGGDFYDFFFIEETHFCFMIGDVLGKGIPGALFMAIARTLLHSKIKEAIGLSNALTSVNEDLCKENKTTTFITLFIGILDIRTGEFEFCNAGHCPPVIYTKEKGFYYYKAEKSLPFMGVISFDYETSTMRLNPGEMLLLYTDGVTEAMNTQREQYSPERLLSLLEKNEGKDPKGVLDSVWHSILTHQAEAEQSDDVTMLAIKYKGSSE